MRILVAALGVALVCSARVTVFADGSCNYGGEYLNGSDVCQAGTRYRCDNGVWQRLGAPCALQSALSQAGCEYQGQFYASGRIGCQSGTGTQQRCDHGEWQSLGTPCVASDGAAALSAVSSVQARSCLYRGARFQAQSVMCDEGLTYVCEGGAWTSLRTPCE